jgi:glycosyltransferase involved in cell wall biosynthesis
MIEAMACGTPVIAYPMGSVPEIIEEGRSGAIVGNRETAVAAVKKIDEFDRGIVRQCFDERFTVERMTAEYIKLYEKLWRARSDTRHRYGPPLTTIPSIDPQPVGA